VWTESESQNLPLWRVRAARFPRGAWWPLLADNGTSMADQACRLAGRASYAVYYPTCIYLHWVRSGGRAEGCARKKLARDGGAQGLRKECRCCFEAVPKVPLLFVLLGRFLGFSCFVLDFQRRMPYVALSRQENKKGPFSFDGRYPGMPWAVWDTLSTLL
jgi:hypothetical protein